MKAGALIVGAVGALAQVEGVCYTPSSWYMAASCTICPAAAANQCTTSGYTPCYDSMAECCKGSEADMSMCGGGGGSGEVPKPETTTPRPLPGTTVPRPLPGTTAPRQSTRGGQPPHPATTVPAAGGEGCFQFSWWDLDCNAQCNSVSKPKSQCSNTSSEGFVWAASKDACISSIKGSHCPGGSSGGSGSGGSGSGGGSVPAGCDDLTGKIPADGFSGKTGVEKLLSEEVFNSMFAQRKTAGTCTGNDFFTYNALVEAAKAYPDFADSGNITTDKRELAAFLAQTSHETTGGWPTAPCGTHSWGFCFKYEVGCANHACMQYCSAGDPCTTNGFGYKCPCAAGKAYSGRGPIQLSWNYNYGQFSFDKYGDSMVLVNDPERIEEDPVLAMEAGLWFWSKPQSPKPSCHDVITGRWSPSASDITAHRHAGFGMTINIINGGLECGHGANDKIDDRVNFYKRYCEMMGVDAGENISCANMRPY